MGTSERELINIENDVPLKHFVQFEKQIQMDFMKYFNVDLAQCIVSFLRMKYVPLDILKEVNQMQRLSTFNKTACMAMLDNLLKVGYHEKEIYDKLLDQLNKNSANINTQNVRFIFSILRRY